MSEELTKLKLEASALRAEKASAASAYEELQAQLVDAKDTITIREAAKIRALEAKVEDIQKELALAQLETKEARAAVAAAASAASVSNSNTEVEAEIVELQTELETVRAKSAAASKEAAVATKAAEDERLQLTQLRKYRADAEVTINSITAECALLKTRNEQAARAIKLERQDMEERTEEIETELHQLVCILHAP